MGTMTRVQIPNEIACISHGANILAKGMHSTILLPDIGKLLDSLGSLTLVW